MVLRDELAALHVQPPAVLVKNLRNRSPIVEFPGRGNMEQTLVRKHEQGPLDQDEPNGPDRGPFKHRVGGAAGRHEDDLLIGVQDVGEKPQFPQQLRFVFLDAPLVDAFMIGKENAGVHGQSEHRTIGWRRFDLLLDRHMIILPNGIEQKTEVYRQIPPAPSPRGKKEVGRKESGFGHRHWDDSWANDTNIQSLTPRPLAFSFFPLPFGFSLQICANR